MFIDREDKERGTPLGVRCSREERCAYSVRFDFKKEFITIHGTPKGVRKLQSYEL